MSSLVSNQRVCGTVLYYITGHCLISTTHPCLTPTTHPCDPRNSPLSDLYNSPLSSPNNFPIALTFSTSQANAAQASSLVMMYRSRTRTRRSLDVSSAISWIVLFLAMLARHHVFISLSVASTSSLLTASQRPDRTLDSPLTSWKTWFRYVCTIRIPLLFGMHGSAPGKIVLFVSIY